MSCHLPPFSIPFALSGGKKSSTVPYFRMTFFFSDMFTQSQLFTFAETIKFKQIRWLFSQPLLSWTKRGKGPQKATSLMAHYVLWWTWSLKYPVQNLFLFYVSRPAPHLGADSGHFSTWALRPIKEPFLFRTSMKCRWGEHLTVEWNRSFLYYSHHVGGFLLAWQIVGRDIYRRDRKLNWKS